MLGPRSFADTLAEAFMPKSTATVAHRPTSVFLHMRSSLEKGPIGYRAGATRNVIGITKNPGPLIVVDEFDIANNFLGPALWI
jgi:hypothetical protein